MVFPSCIVSTPLKRSMRFRHLANSPVAALESFRGLSTNTTVSPLSLAKYIEDVRPMLKPPVANRMIFNEQLQVMVVGGPNQRKDFHINEGEEIFYQLEGDMELKILEQGKHKTVVIPEGHMFILPSRIPHSPQRFENTIGMVVERLRHKHESDGLRYFVDESTDVLYEEYFHCKDLGSELVPVINRFFASDAYRMNIPGPDMPVANPPVQIDHKTAVTAKPFPFSDFLSTLRSKNNAQPQIIMSALSGAEFNINIAFGSCDGVLQAQRSGDASNTFLWQVRGQADVMMKSESGSVSLKEGDIHLVMAGDEIQCRNGSDDSCLLAITTNSFD